MNFINIPCKQCDKSDCPTSFNKYMIVENAKSDNCGNEHVYTLTDEKYRGRYIFFTHTSGRSWYCSTLDGWNGSHGINNQYVGRVATKDIAWEEMKAKMTKEGWS